MGARQTVGDAEIVKAMTNNGWGPFPGTTGPQQATAWVSAVKDISTELVDCCTKYLNNSMDAWGTMAHMQECKLALEKLLRGVH